MFCPVLTLHDPTFWLLPASFGWVNAGTLARAPVRQPAAGDAWSTAAVSGFASRREVKATCGTGFPKRPRVGHGGLKFKVKMPKPAPALRSDVPWVYSVNHVLPGEPGRPVPVGPVKNL